MSRGGRVLSAAKAAARQVLPQWAYGPIRARRVRRLVDAYPSRTVRHSYGGLELVVRLEDPLAEGWYDRDWDEPPESTRLRRGRLGPGATVFDIGAHQGIFALMLASIVGEGGRVVAVEAERHNAAVARINIAGNTAENVTVIHAAGAAHEGSACFTEGLNGVLARDRAAGSVEVATVTVDGLAERYGTPDVVLIDVEGHEEHVLDGSRHAILSGRTDFFVELHDAAALTAAHSSAERVLRHFDCELFEIDVAITEDAGGDPGPGSSAAVWTALGSKARVSGKRCFVVARQRMGTSEEAHQSARSGT